VESITEHFAVTVALVSSNGVSEGGRCILALVSGCRSSWQTFLSLPSFSLFSPLASTFSFEMEKF
jgi:hypothetical protein